eukprot:CAMPEP_0119402380 /NCGR_PEP_ID=MMETSP1334-20130426/142849_1 /TAXON_ID=127549 /ORGANISM="Calcidiscus leptoporus, Strain RCC1130" /LENGTH=153 /DNA_ID=CAMNT_0007426309 /DNA_START=386 /DNA_END=847 /DNA_ORIENTATION=+
MVKAVWGTAHVTHCQQSPHCEPKGQQVSKAATGAAAGGAVGLSAREREQLAAIVREEVGGALARVGQVDFAAFCGRVQLRVAAALEKDEAAVAAATQACIGEELYRAGDALVTTHARKLLQVDWDGARMVELGEFWGRSLAEAFDRTRDTRRG